MKALIVLVFGALLAGCIDVDAVVAVERAERKARVENAIKECRDLGGDPVIEVRDGRFYRVTHCVAKNDARGLR